MPDDLPELRASHGDRDRAVETLRIAAGDGRLDADELDTRLEQALAAKTLSELAELTADLVPPTDPVLVIEQDGGKYVKEGHWRVPSRIDVRTSLCRVTLDLTQAVITENVLHVNAEMAHGRLTIVGAPGVLINTDGLNLTFSKVKLRSKETATEPRLRIEVTGTLIHAKVVEKLPRSR